MTSLFSLTQTQAHFGINKADAISFQLLLVTKDLLDSAQLFIDDVYPKSFETVSKYVFQLLYLLTYLSAWLSHVTMLFLGFLNKYLTRFLIHKTLSLAHSTSYILPALTKCTFSSFRPLDY